MTPNLNTPDPWRPDPPHSDRPDLLDRFMEFCETYSGRIPYICLAVVVIYITIKTGYDCSHHHIQMP